ncbi:MAG: histidine phosphatase family protein [Bryobacteraceae bacterium]
MNARPELWLARHGETEWSLSGQHTGRTDIPLTDRGRAAAGTLVRQLAGHSFEAVWTSGLQRARETATLAGFPSAIVNPDLLEWDYGVYEGRTSADIRQTEPDWSIWTATVAGGESIDEVAARARHAIETASALGGNVLIFSHGHLLRILTSTWLGLPPDAGRLFALDTTTVSVLGYEGSQRVIRRWNQA